MGNSPLPFADGGFGEKQLVGKLLLGHTQCLALGADISAEALFIFHRNISLSQFPGCHQDSVGKGGSQLFALIFPLDCQESDRKV